MTTNTTKKVPYVATYKAATEFLEAAIQSAKATYRATDNHYKALDKIYMDRFSELLDKHGLNDFIDYHFMITGFATSPKYLFSSVALMPYNNENIALHATKSFRARMSYLQQLAAQFIKINEDLRLLIAEHGVHPEHKPQPKQSPMEELLTAIGITASIDTVDGE